MSTTSTGKKKVQGLPRQKSMNSNTSQEEQKSSNSSQIVKESNSNYTKYSEKLFINKEELRAFLLPGPQTVEFTCKFCEDKYGKEYSTFKVKSLKSHIDSVKHELATPKGKYTKELELLKVKYEQEDLKKKEKKVKIADNHNQKILAETKNYLEFLAFAL